LSASVDIPMSEAGTIRATRPLQAAGALIAGCAIAIFVLRSLAGPLWMDELLTMQLVQADSLPRLWSGIISGIDGNPPLYLTMAWLIVHAIPQAMSAAAVLKLASVALTAAAIFALFRIGRRVASAAACWIGVILMVTLNNNVSFVALELRTYALYFLMAALAVLFQQRLIERRRTRDLVVLALIYVGLTLAHTFGIVYVGCIALAGWLSQPGDGRLRYKSFVAGTVPAIIILAAWIPFFVRQSDVARPYSWIESPGLPELLESLFASRLSMWIAIVELCCLAGAAIAGLRGGFKFRSVLHDPQWQPYRFMILVLIGMTGFTLTGWVASVTLFPLFVPRYFTPQLIAGFALHVAFGEWLVRLARQGPQARMAGLAICAIILPASLSNAATLFRDSDRGTPHCADSGGNFFENDFVRGDLPVITESPHIFLPRATYARHPEAYRFALDWEVVLNYPQRSRGNAVDFNIMKSLRTWAPMPSVMSTEEIVGKFPQFLAIEQSGRAWFHHLRATREVVAEKLAEVGTDGYHSCTLWKVTSTKPRP
jgi:hypothetical protein